MVTTKTQFAPHLTLSVLRPAIKYYEEVFHAKTVRMWPNTDGSIHVAELEIGGQLFHLHEETPGKGQLSPGTLSATSVLIGLFTPTPDEYYQNALAAGGQIVSAMQDYEYGYRQGTVVDPFGHQWLIQKRI